MPSLSYRYHLLVSWLRPAVSEMRGEKISLPGAGGLCCQAAASGQGQSPWGTRFALALPDPRVTCKAGGCDELSSRLSGAAGSAGSPSCSSWRSAAARLAVCPCRAPRAGVLRAMPPRNPQRSPVAVSQPGAEPGVWPCDTWMDQGASSAALASSSSSMARAPAGIHPSEPCGSFFRVLP